MKDRHATHELGDVPGEPPLTDQHATHEMEDALGDGKVVGMRAL